jgi:hypothetical protein
MSGSRICGDDGNPDNGGGTARVYTGQSIFTPDNTNRGTSSSSAFFAWSSYWISMSVTDPTTVNNVTPDPTDSSQNLSETPIQWGSIDMAIFRSQIPLLFNSSIPTPTNSIQNGPTPFFITSFSYSAPIDGVSVGYAGYIWKEDGQDWRRFIINFNNSTNQTTYASATSTYSNEAGNPCIRLVQFNQ